MASMRLPSLPCRDSPRARFHTLGRIAIIGTLVVPITACHVASA